VHQEKILAEVTGAISGLRSQRPARDHQLPNGGTLTHVYDSTGRLAQLNWNGAPLVTGLTWNPMGQPTAWTWAFSTPVAASRTYDTAARLTATECSAATSTMPQAASRA